MPISTLWAKSMPSIFSRKPCTKCWRACSPSVTISTPASSCSLSASTVASRLARANSAPADFQGAHNLLGSASHSGFGREPAIVVGNSIWASRTVLVERLSAMSYGWGTRTTKVARAGLWVAARTCRGSHDRPSLCADAEWLENLDHAGRTRASLQRRSRQYPGRRPVQAGVLGDQPEQPDSGDRGSAACRRRRAVFGVRDRRHPDLSGRKDRPLFAEGHAWPLQGDAMGDVADE